MFIIFFRFKLKPGLNDNNLFFGIRNLIINILDFIGERFDFVLNADKSPDSYWIQLSGVGPGCSHLQQLAILRYESATSDLPKLPRPSWEDELYPGIVRYSSYVFVSSMENFIKVLKVFQYFFFIPKEFTMVLQKINGLPRLFFNTKILTNQLEFLFFIQ